VSLKEAGGVEQRQAALELVFGHGSKSRVWAPRYDSSYSTWTCYSKNSILYMFF
jgi:hypothetical protein